MPKIAPQAAMVTVYRLADGAPVDRWPVDAKELVASGQFGYEPPVLDVRDEVKAENTVPTDAEGAEVLDEAPVDEPTASRKKKG